MRFLRSVFLWLFVAALVVATCFGQGQTYPDGTVSPFKPAFFGVGITEPATASYVFGVGAQGGKFNGAVGQINGKEGAATQQPALFNGSNSFFGLPRFNNLPTGGTAVGISDDGKIKIGFGPETGVYWDATNQVHALPVDMQYALATGITPDGTLIAGSVLTGVQGDVQIYEACKWTPNGSAPLRLGIPAGFQSSFANAISESGNAVAGDAAYLDNSTTPPTGRVRPFLYRNGQIETLPTGNGEDGTAHAISENDEAGKELYVVGEIGPAGAGRGALWAAYEGGPAQAFGLANTNGTTSSALAIRARCQSPGGRRGRIVGYLGTALIGTSAFMWSRDGEVEGTIQGLLKNTYKTAVPALWDFTIAYALSGDGYTVGGIGFNPQSKIEGWVAVMPPILYPPIVTKPPDQIARPGEPFFYQVKATRTGFNLPLAFSASGLPKGFSIDKDGRIAGIWFASETEKIRSYTVTVKATTDEGTGTATFTLSLLPLPGATNPANPKSIQGHTYLQQNKPPDEATFLASFSSGTSADGQVAVGHDGFGDESRAYRWTATEGATGLPMIDGALRTFSTALAVSADGQTIVGQAARAPADDGTNRSVAVVWRTAAANVNVKAQKIRQRHYAESETTTLEAIDLGLFPKGTLSSANGVSANGSVVVGYTVGRDPDPSFKFDVYQAFRWTQATGMVGLGWLDTQNKFSQAFGVSADGSVIVGLDSAQAFRWTEATGMVGLGKGPGALASVAKAISADNSTIIGFNTYNAQNDNNRGFRWRAGEGFVDLGVLPGDQYSEANAVSADGGTIVGVSGVKFVSARAFIWDQANGMRDLKSVLVAGNPSLANWTLISADAISADGKTITGAGTNPNGDREGYTAVLEVRSPQLLNISTRMRVLTGDKVMIGGFIITGAEAKKVMIRGIGPSLGNFGLQGVMGDPTLELHQGNTTIARNDNWKLRPDGSSQQVEIEGTTIAPSNDLESAIVMTLNPGSYTAILAGKDNAPGLGIVEVYDLARQSNSKLANISTRGFVDTGDNVMIGGFIAGGGTVGGYAGELVRAIGPSLTGAGVAGALQDTTLELYNGNGVLVAGNDNWKLRSDGSSQEADIRATTIPPADDRESAVVAALAPGNYTAIVRGKNNATGIAGVEAYNLQ
ncbi:MAG: hypothetical protein QOD12_2345 [Verrucomicrobiota bacterium]|jgi:probable HAF family extracellular repeat protein